MNAGQGWKGLCFVGRMKAQEGGAGGQGGLSLSSTPQRKHPPPREREGQEGLAGARRRVRHSLGLCGGAHCDP